MARFRRMLAPLITIKHMVNVESSTIANGVAVSTEIVQAVGQTAVTNTTDVVEGSVVKTCYVELWIKSNAAAGGNAKFQLILEKITENSVPITFTEMNNLMTYPNKKNILFSTQGVIGDLSTQSVPVMRDWYSIPKGKQRFGLGDELVVTVSATTADIRRCGLFIFKEWK